MMKTAAKFGCIEAQYAARPPLKLVVTSRPSMSTAVRPLGRPRLGQVCNHGDDLNAGTLLHARVITV